MRALGLVLAAGSIGIAAPAIADDDNVILEPTSPWHASYNDGLCRLGRMFDLDGQEHLLVIDQRWPSEEFDITAAGPSLSELKTNSDTQLIFADDTQLRSNAPAVRQQIDKWGAAIVLLDARIRNPAAASQADKNLTEIRATDGRLDIEAARQTRYIAIEQENMRVLFATGSLADPFSVLNDCTSHVLSTWGLDAEKHRSAKSLPRLENAKATSSRMTEYYPSSALRNEEEGRVELNVIVEIDGTVSECLILASSGSEALDQAACSGFRRARFSPALDAEGQPMRSYLSTAITYRLN